MGIDVASSPAPETLRQAQRWEAVKDRYVAEGLCHRCAAQAAWAHQNHGGSWETIHPPCAACEPIVAEFPAATPSMVWRKVPRPEAEASMTCRNAVADNHVLIVARVDAQLMTAAAQGGGE